MLTEDGGGLKSTAGKRVQPDYHFIQVAFCSFLFLLARVLFSLAGYAQEDAKHILDIVGQSQAEV